MPLIGPTIVARATADAGISALIASRLYPHYDLQSDRVYPLAVYKLENAKTQLASTGPTGFIQLDFIVAAIAPTYAAASQLSDALEAALDGAQWTDGTNAVCVQGVFLAEDGRRDDVITEPTTEAILYYVSELTFNVSFNATS